MKNNIRKRIIVFTLLCALVLGGVLVSYAFFIGAGNNTKQEALTVNSGNIALTFNDGTDSFQGSLNFGESATKTFTIENTGSIDATARMKWDNLTNTYLNGSLTYTLSYSETENGTYTEIVSNKQVPRSTETSTKLLADNLTIPVRQKYFYKLTITLNYLDDKDQTADLNAILSTNFTLEDRTNIKTYTLMARPSYDYTGLFWNRARAIKTVTFETEMNPKENATYSYDVSEAKDGSVMSYLVQNEEDSNKYDLYIQANGEITANKNFSHFFHNFTSLEIINGLELLDTSNVINMWNTFNNCSSLESLNLSSFDTSNVTTMNSMFSNCSSLTTLNLSSFNTSNVTTMNSMFYNCSNLTTLNLSNFDTSNVIDMSYMFSNCNSLTTIDVSNFDTSNVTNMQSMFDSCHSLTELDLSNFNTNCVTDMQGMFSICSSLLKISVSNFNTSNVTNMNNMFSNCSNLEILEISNFDTSNVTNMNSMFSNCSNLTTLDLSNFDTSNVTSMDSMFYGCNSLTTLDLSNFDTSNVNSMSYMFSNCSKLTTTITIRGTKCTSYYEMFYLASTLSEAKITVNYTADASSLADQMIATKSSSSSNVIKGIQVT